MRKSRDDEIRYLANLPNRNPRQDERLRTLNLEKEFERRAEEERDDEDDEEVLDRAEHRERMLSMKQYMEQIAQKPIDYVNAEIRDLPQPKSVLISRPNHDDWIRRNNRNHNNSVSQLEETEERLRRLRFEENKRKQEFEAAQQLEEKLILEARRRQVTLNSGLSNFRTSLNSFLLYRKNKTRTIF